MAGKLDDTSASAAFREWQPQLDAYIGGQGEIVAPLRARNIPEPPYPESDNPMVGYLIARRCSRKDD